MISGCDRWPLKALKVAVVISGCDRWPLKAAEGGCCDQWL